MNAPWYVSNSDIHHDLGVDDVATVIKFFAPKHEARLHQNVNVEANKLLNHDNQTRRLKKTKPFELV